MNTTRKVQFGISGLYFVRMFRVNLTRGLTICKTQRNEDVTQIAELTGAELRKNNC